MIPLRFEYISKEYNGQRIYVSVLQQFKHHYHGHTVYRVRQESDAGWVDEGFFLAEHLLEWLETKVV